MTPCCARRPEIILTTKRLTDAGTVIVTPAEAKTHLRVNWATEDALITALIETAGTQAEQWTDRTFFGGTFTTEFDYFPNILKMDIAPVDTTSIVVKYSDVDDNEQTLAATEYFVRNPGLDDFVTIEFNGTIPPVFNKENAVRVEFSAGYAVVPGPVKSAVLMQIATLFENRQSEVQGSMSLISNGAKSLLFPYKLL